jgi:hypothetical protein
MKLHGLSPNSYIHVSVSDVQYNVHIFTISLPIVLQENTVGGPIVVICI